MITIIDYGSGNIGAISRLLHIAALEYEIARTPDSLMRSTHLILPGVGAIDPTMLSLRSSGLDQAVVARVQTGDAVLLGVCVGMHVLATGSEEGATPCLNLIPGEARRFDEAAIQVASKVPHMGWNSITPTTDHPLLQGLDLERGFYFLHSYRLGCGDRAHVLATTNHGGEFDSVIANGVVYGVQFHPEKSHRNGVRLIQNFSRLRPC